MSHKPEIIGTVATTKTFVIRESYECADWYMDIECPPQTANVWMTRSPEGHPNHAGFGLSGKVIDASFTPLFGGVAIGKDRGHERIGEERIGVIQIYPYNLIRLDGLNLKEEYRWLLENQDSWHRNIADYKLREYIEHKFPWGMIRQFMNPNYLLQHGSHELLAQIQP